MEQAINLLDQLSQKIATLTTKKIPKFSFSKNDNEWRTFISQSKPHWEDISWRVKVPNESGESEVHLGFYSAKTSDLFNSAIIEVSNEFQSKTDNIIKNENGIRLVWNVNVNDPASIDKVVTAITDIITNFFVHAQKVLFVGKEKTSFKAPVVTTETVNNTAPKNHIETYTWDDGNVYEGEWKESSPHGKGKMICADGDVYEGEWSEGYKHGKGKMNYANGDVYDGNWKDGEKQGIGKMTYGEDNLEGADSYEGEWEIDCRHGLGKMIYKDTLWNWSDYSVYEGEWIDDSHHFGKMNYVNGDVYEGSWSILGNNGNGKMTYADGGVYEGEFSEGKFHGQGKYTKTDGTVYEGEFSEGNFDRGKMTYANGDFYDGNWSAGLPHGWGSMKYANKDYYFGDWNKGMRHGYAKSLINGEAITLWENDKPKIEIKWDNYTWDNGNYYEGYWKGKYPHGEGKETYANGGWREGEFEEGIFISGKGKLIYKGGDYYEGELKGGQRHGYGEYHFKTGAVESGNYYEDLNHGRRWYDSDGDGLGYYAEYVYGERKYKEGSVVQLKSGGPNMTVTDVSRKTITCNWISYGKNKSEDYDEDSLTFIR